MPGAGVGVAGGSVGTLAYTGMDVGWWITIGVVLLALGLTVVVASYRRTKRMAHSK